MFNFIIYKIAAFVVQVLPQHLSYRLAEFLADLHLFFYPQDKRALINNLKIISPKAKDFPRLAREVSRNFGKYLTDFFRLPFVDKKFINKNVKLENLNYIDESLKKGKGVIIVSAHVGSWELGAVVLASLGYEVAAVVLKHKQKLVDDFFNQQRKNKGFLPIPLAEAARKCLEHLKQNKIIILLVDRNFTDNGLVMDFLNRKAMLPKGAAIFSLKTGAEIIPGLLLRNNDHTFTLHFDSAITPLYTQDRDFDTKSLMQRYILVIESYIRRSPEQWLMFREFWLNEK